MENALDRRYMYTTAASAVAQFINRVGFTENPTAAVVNATRIVNMAHSFKWLFSARRMACEKRG